MIHPTMTTVRQTGAVRRGWSLAFAAAGLVLAVQGHGETLSVDGTVLPPVMVQPALADIGREIELGGDRPIATYVIANPSGSVLLQRTNAGYWVPWDGLWEHLIDNYFQAAGDRLFFKVVKEDLSGREFPFNVIVAYRTADAIKFGVFSVGRAQ